MSKKTVLLPIEVPEGDFCWEFKADGLPELCQHFDNEGGHPICDLQLGQLQRGNKKGILKPPECSKLAEPKKE